MRSTSFQRVIARCTVVLLLLCGRAALATAQDAADDCSPGGPPAFLTAANDIHYGCEYLVDATPPNYTQAASYFRQALEKEPNNAVARYLLGVSLAGSGDAAGARAAIAEATRLDPRVRARIDPFFQKRPALLAAAEGRSAAPATAAARPAAPATRPAAPPAARPAAPPAARATPAAPRAAAPAGAFPVGARVEIEYRAGEWFPGVVTSVDPGVCPYYNVRADVYGNGNPSTLGYGCKTVRAPTGIAQPVAACGGSNPNCAPKSPPPLGRYGCNVTLWDVAEGRAKYDYKGYFELLAGGRYRWLDNGGTGTYAYDPASYRVTWRSGPMVAHGGRASYGLDGTTPEITIVMETEYTRRTGNDPVRWQCARSR